MRILSYNIQAAIASDSYLSYVSRLHRQVLPSAAKSEVLSRIGRYIADFDVACLQEVDLGGFRNGFQNQINQLLDVSPFAHYLWQHNRTVGKLSLHGNLILSKLPLREAVNTLLPARIKGRGMLAAEIDHPSGSLIVANVHLSLGALDQAKQIRFIYNRLKPYTDVCLMGDFNCPPHARQLALLTDRGYTRLNSGNTYPSWRPSQTLDHIFVKGRLNGRSEVSPFTASDHLPVVVEIDL